MRPRAVIPVVVLVSLLGQAAAADLSHGVPGAGRELLRYDWRLEGLTGLLARLLRRVPSSGQGVLSTRPRADGRVLCRFRATSPRAREGDHWTYRAELDPSVPRTLRIVETLRLRDKRKRRVHHLAEDHVLDLLSGLHVLRRSLPERDRRATLWSDRELYTVLIVPRGLEARETARGTRILRHLSIRGVREPGIRFWKDEAEIWLTNDEAAVPVEILLRSGVGRLRLRLIGQREPTPGSRTGRSR